MKKPETSSQQTEAKTQPLNRQQRREIERVKQDAMSTLNKLLAKYYEFFMDNDPQSNEVKEKQKELSAKWKMYCRLHNLNDSALKLCDENIEKINQNFQAQLAES